MTSTPSAASDSQDPQETASPLESEKEDQDTSESEAETRRKRPKRRRTKRFDATYQSLTTFCSNQNKRPMDLIVDSYNPMKLPPDMQISSTVYLQLDQEVDNLVADDIFGLKTRDLDFLSSFAGSYRVNMQVRQIGSSSYLALDSQRTSRFIDSNSLLWTETESIQILYYKFSLKLSQCVELGVLTSLIDQLIHYLTKVTSNRSQNSAVVVARNAIKIQDCNNLH